MSIELKVACSAVLFILTIIAGIWLSRKGKPYNTFIFTVHKLIALAAAVFTIVFIFNLFKSEGFTSLTIALIVAAGTAVVLFVSGALLSAGKAPYGLMKTIHIVSTVAAAIIIPVSVYLPLKK